MRLLRLACLLGVAVTSLAGCRSLDFLSPAIADASSDPDASRDGGARRDASAGDGGGPISREAGLDAKSAGDTGLDAKTGGDAGPADTGLGDVHLHDAIADTHARDAIVPRADAADATTDSPIPCGDAGTRCGSSCAYTQDDPNNCGGCDLVCAGTCSAGRCRTVLASYTTDSGTTGAGRIAVDSSFVYFTVTGAVNRVPLQGGAANVSQLIGGHSSYHFTGLALDTTNAYAVCDDSYVNAVGKSGTYVGSLPGISPFDITVDTTNAYWTSYTSGDGVFVFPKASFGDSTAHPKTLITRSGVLASGIASDGTRVYWTDVGAGTINAILPDGTSSTTLAMANVGDPTRLAYARDALFWVDTQGAAIRKLSLTGAETEVCVVGYTNGSPLSLAVLVDDPNVYYATATSVMKLPSTCPSNPHAALQASLATGTAISDVAVDGTSVYWLDTRAGVGTVNAVSPK